MLSLLKIAFTSNNFKTYTIKPLFEPNDTSYAETVEVPSLKVIYLLLYEATTLNTLSSKLPWTLNLFISKSIFKRHYEPLVITSLSYIKVILMFLTVVAQGPMNDQIAHSST